MTWTQEDTNSTLTAACSGLTAGTAIAKRGIVGGSAGSSEGTISHPTSASGTLRLAHFGLVVPAGTTWGASTFTIRLNVTTANMFLDWVSAYVCRVNSSFTNQATMGSNLSVGNNLGSTGTLSTTVSTSSQTPNTGDLVYIVCGFTNGQTMANAAGITPSLNIDADGFTAPGGGTSIFRQASIIEAVYGDLATQAGILL